MLPLIVLRLISVVPELKIPPALPGTGGVTVTELLLIVLPWIARVPLL
jgi:hypothetical protein